MTSLINYRNVQPVFGLLTPNPKASSETALALKARQFGKGGDISQLGIRRAEVDSHLVAKVGDSMTAYTNPRFWGINNAIGMRISLSHEPADTIDADRLGKIQKSLLPGDEMTVEEMTEICEKYVEENYQGKMIDMHAGAVTAYINTLGEDSALFKKLKTLLGEADDSGTYDHSLPTIDASSLLATKPEVVEFLLVNMRNEGAAPQAIAGAELVLAVMMLAIKPEIGFMYEPFASEIERQRIAKDMETVPQSEKDAARDIAMEVLADAREFEGKRARQVGEAKITIDVLLPHEYRGRYDSGTMTYSSSLDMEESEDWDANYDGGNDTYSSRSRPINTLEIESFYGPLNGFGYDGRTASQRYIEDGVLMSTRSSPDSKGDEDDEASVRDEDKATKSNLENSGTSDDAWAESGAGDEDDSGSKGDDLEGKRKSKRSSSVKFSKRGTPRVIYVEDLTDDKFSKVPSNDADWIADVLDGDYNDHSGAIRKLDLAGVWRTVEFRSNELAEVFTPAMVEFVLGATQVCNIDIESAKSEILGHFCAARSYILRHCLYQPGAECKVVEDTEGRHDFIGFLPYEAEEVFVSDLESGACGPIAAFASQHSFMKSGHTVTANGLAHTVNKVKDSVCAEGDTTLKLSPAEMGDFLGSSVYTGNHFADKRLVQNHFKILASRNELSYSMSRRLTVLGPGTVGPFLVSKVLDALDEAKFFKLTDRESSYAEFKQVYKSYSSQCHLEVPYAQYMYGVAKSESTGFKNFIAQFAHYAHALHEIMPGSSYNLSISLGKLSKDVASNSITANLEVAAFVKTYKRYIGLLVSRNLENRAGSRQNLMIEE